MHTRGRVCPFLDSKKEPLEIAEIFGLGNVSICEPLSLSLSRALLVRKTVLSFLFSKLYWFCVEVFVFVSSWRQRREADGQVSPSLSWGFFRRGNSREFWIFFSSELRWFLYLHSCPYLNWRGWMRRDVWREEIYKVLRRKLMRTCSSCFVGPVGERVL